MSPGKVTEILPQNQNEQPGVPSNAGDKDRKIGSKISPGPKHETLSEK
jgi:hypothetical protein